MVPLTGIEPVSFELVRFLDSTIDSSIGWLLNFNGHNRHEIMLSKTVCKESKISLRATNDVFIEIGLFNDVAPITTNRMLNPTSTIINI
jgi:hypothetical protein|tara:strand:+ start:101 stop:367 length:267 start_codon:yes stop_codon:yes gene_type:complete